jgi:hypothetical protein
MNQIFMRIVSVNFLFLSMFMVLFSSLLMSGCSSTLKIHSDFIPAGSLRLAQVVAIGKRADIVTQFKETYDAMIASGIKDSDIVDGSVVVARIYCCGGITAKSSTERVNDLWLYVPQGLDVALGDIVEVRSGRSPKDGDAGVSNTVTRIAEKHGTADSKCWWDPKNDRLWARILYCSWMPDEGWVKYEGFYQTWYKPVPGPDK